MILPSVFVEIPSQNANLTTTRTASTSRPNEIKAEPPIKSETDNANHTQSLAIKKATTDATCSIPSTSTQYSPVASGSVPKVTSDLVTARPKVKCLKCDKCPFMSISQQGYDEHIRTVHTDGAPNTTQTKRIYRDKLLCPGCDNVFYSKMSLKIHLVNDHQMNRVDIKQLLDSVLVKRDLATIAEHPAPMAPAVARQYVEVASGKRIETQKIYLKNVEVLQNPKFTAHRINTSTVQDSNFAAVEIPGVHDNLSDNFLTLNNQSFELPTTMVRYEQIECDNTFQQHVETLPAFSFVSPSLSPQPNVGLHINNGNQPEPVILRAISPTITPPSIDDSNGLPPNSRYSAQQAWATNSAPNSNLNFVEYSTALGVNPMTGESTATASTASSDQSEQKKIFIKNIDILMKPILHLRTVDEVNLLINKVILCAFVITIYSR